MRGAVPLAFVGVGDGVVDAEALPGGDGDTNSIGGLCDMIGGGGGDAEAGIGLPRFGMLEKGGDLEGRLLPGGVNEETILPLVAEEEDENKDDDDDDDGGGGGGNSGATGNAAPAKTAPAPTAAEPETIRDGLAGDADGEGEGEEFGVELTEDAGDGDGARDEARDEFADEALLLCRS
jgi:hypothetical protein